RRQALNVHPLKKADGGMSPLVYIVRHGETAWNVEYRLQGQADVPLNDEGRRQATANGLRLAQLIPNPEEFDFVASPMQRTRSTMELIRAAMKLDPTDYRTDPRLMEMSFGDWQGFTFAELEAQNPGSTRGAGAGRGNGAGSAGACRHRCDGTVPSTGGRCSGVEGGYRTFTELVQVAPVYCFLSGGEWI